MYTVSSITVNDGNGNVATTTYSYAGGYYHLGEREFRGFNSVTVTGPEAAGERTITKTWFHQGNDTAVDVNDPTVAEGYLQGLPYRTKVTDGNGKLYTETTTTYTADADGAAPYFTPPASVVTKLCNGTTCGQTTRTSYSYDAYGNVTQEVQRGGTSTSADDRTVARTYSPNTTKWIVGLPTRERIHAGVGTTGTKLAQTDFYYDGTTSCSVASTTQTPTTGSLTRTVRWLSGATTSPETRMAYDAKGNVICTRDALGYTTTLGYDTSGTFVTRVTNPKGQVTQTAYYGVNGVATTHGLYGQVKSVTEANGGVVTTQYDAVGRRTTVTSPDGFWTTTQYNNLGTVGSQHVRTTSQLGLSTWTYFDGLGRPIKTERTGPEQKKIVTRTEYDARGAVKRTSAPAFVSASTLPVAVAPTVTIGEVTSVAKNATQTLTASVSSGTYDALAYAWRVMTGGGTLDGSGASVTYTPTDVSVGTVVKVRVTVTALGTETTAQAGTSATAFDEETFRVTTGGTSPAPQLALAAPTVTVAEGGTATMQVRLTAAPTGTVTVTATENDADISLSPSSRSFTTSTWNTYQAFTVTGVQDADAVHESATVTLSASGGGVTDTASVAVTITDDDPPPTDTVPTFGTTTIPDQTYTVGTAIPTLQLPAASGGNSPLTYTVTPALPAGLTFAATTRQLTGTPTTATGATTYTYTVTDADQDTATLTFALTVVDPNLPANWSGQGTSTDPYIISGLPLAAAEIGALIRGSGTGSGSGSATYFRFIATQAGAYTIAIEATLSPASGDWDLWGDRDLRGTSLGSDESDTVTLTAGATQNFWIYPYNAAARSNLAGMRLTITPPAPAVSGTGVSTDPYVIPAALLNTDLDCTLLPNWRQLTNSGAYFRVTVPTTGTWTATFTFAPSPKRVAFDGAFNTTATTDVASPITATATLTAGTPVTFDVDPYVFTLGTLTSATLRLDAPAPPPAGDAGKFWVVDEGDDKVYAYNSDGTRAAASDFNLGTGNNHPNGLAYGNGKIWVVDDTDDVVYAYNSNGTRVVASDFNLGTGNNHPGGIACGNGKIWVADGSDDKVFAYNSEGTRVAVSDFNFGTGNNNVNATTYANGKFWIVDEADDKVYAYNSDGTRATASDFNLGAGNNHPGGIDYGNGKFWVVDGIDDKVYAYNSDGTRATASDFSLGTENGNPDGIIYQPVQLQVESTTIPVDEGGTATIQVWLTAAPTGTVTVTAAESDAAISLSPVSRSFTPATWNTYQTFTVTGLQDSDMMDDNATVTLSASGGGVSDTASVTVTITDDDLPAPTVSGTGISSDPYVIPAALLNTDLDCTLLPNWNQLTNSGAYFRVTIPATGTWTATFTFAPSPKRVEFDGVFNTGTTTEVASPITAATKLSAGTTITFDVDPYVFTLGTLASATLRLESPPTVTYSDTTPALGTQVTATLSATTGISSYQWQYQRPSGSTWYNVSLPGATTRTLTLGTSLDFLGYHYRLAWKRNGTWEYAANAVTATLASTSPLTVTYSDTTPAPGAQVTATLRVVSATTGISSYQWQHQSASGAAWQNSSLPGATTQTITLGSSSSYVGYKYRLTWTRSGTREYAANAVTVTALSSSPPTVTYSDTTPALGTQVTATLSATTGISSYQWQYQTPSGSTWYNSSRPGATTRTITLGTSSSYVGYQYRLTWTRNGTWEYASSAVTVTAASSSPLTVTYSDTTPTLGGHVTATLSATTGISSYQWQYQRPSESTWHNSGATGATTRTITLGTSSGLLGYQYRLTWTRSGTWEYAANAVTVTAAANTPLTVTYSDTTPAPGTRVTATLSATTGISSYQWQYQRPSESRWYNSGYTGATTRTITLGTSSSGILGYQYRLTWTRNGTWEYAANAVTVTAAGNSPPTVTYSATTPALGAQVTATLSATTGISSYQWQYQTPSGSTWENSGLTGATTRTITLGTLSSYVGYKYRLTWTRSGTWEYAPNVVTVTGSSTSVTANAGADKTVTSGGTVTLNGSASVTNGSGATTYAWAKVSGTGGSLSSATVATPTFTAPTVTATRTLTYRLTATNNGVSDTDDVVLTVTVPTVAPGTPGTPTLSSRTPTSLTVRTTAPTTGGTPTLYRWRYSTNHIVSDYDPKATSSGPTVTISNLSANTNYWIDVRAENSIGQSSYTADLATATTTAGTPSELTLAAPTVTVTEGGTATIQVRLTAQPTGTVTVTATETDADISLSPSSQSFTTTTWNTYQTFTVTGLQDSDTVDDSATVTLSASSGGVSDTTSVPVTITDDDRAPPPTVTYSDITPAPGAQVTATLSATTGISSYHWQFQRPSESTWNYSGYPGAATRTITLGTSSSGILGSHYRLTWVRSGTREYASNTVTVTSGSTSVTANAGADKTVTSGVVAP